MHRINFRTHNEFLAAILAAPTDQAPRLIYADWLDDHGCSKAAAKQRYYVSLMEKAVLWQKRSSKAGKAKGLYTWDAFYVPVKSGGFATFFMAKNGTINQSGYHLGNLPKQNKYLHLNYYGATT